MAGVTSKVDLASDGLDGAIVLGDPDDPSGALVLGDPGPDLDTGPRYTAPGPAPAPAPGPGLRLEPNPGTGTWPTVAPAGTVEPARAGAEEEPRLDWDWPLRMVNPVRSHGWGAHTGLSRVQRRPAARRPEAELWIGAHPIASSTLVDPDGREISLLEAVEVDPEGLLGRPHRNRFGARLPFLLKVIAVERALSVQVHPARRQAAEGFARQEAAGIPLRSAGRMFIDPHPKPELVVALTPFDALIGLRDPRHAVELMDLLDVAPLLPMRRALGAAAATSHGPARDGTLDALVRLAAWPYRQRAVLAAGVCDAARAALVNPLTAHHPDARSALEWVIRLADQHPGDPMVLAPLLLDFVHLEPGQSAFLPPGVLHTFLCGVALEAAACSANVVRAGLTRRPVDPAAVAAVVDVAARPLLDVGQEQLGRHESALLTPAEEFRLSRITLGGTGVVAPAPRPVGPQVMLCLDGEVEVQVGTGPRPAHLRSGESAYLGPQARDVVLGGEGTVYRITTGG
jgi:mannose-6-phosphate isomerase